MMATRTGRIEVAPAATLHEWWQETATRLQAGAARLVSRLPGRRRLVELTLVALAVFAVVAFLLVLGTESHHRR